jgi:VWFA-related protein
MRCRLLWLCSVLLFYVALTHGQKAANAGAPVSSTTLTTTTRNVVLDVIVTDGAGRPVHGLKPSDFVVLESGKRQQLKAFEEQRAEVRAVKSAPMPKLPANTYTNYLTSSDSGAANIILFDSLNTGRMNLARAREQLLQYLAKLPVNTRVALFTLDGSLHLVHGFTNDTHELAQAAQKLSLTPNHMMRKAREVSEDKALAAEAGVSKSPRMYAMLVNFLWSEYEGKIDSRTETTMEALNQLARSMAVFPGRKNLIWISDGIPFDPTSTAPQMEKTAALLSATQIAVYPIDLHGVASLEADGATRSSEIFGSHEDYGDSSGQNEELLTSHQTMTEVARLTGGRAYFNSNDMPSQMEQIVAAGSNYYTVAYRPEDQNWNGKFRKVAVKVSSPNVKVQCRSGYYAVADPFGTPDVDRTFSLAMQPGVPASTALVIQARVLPPDAPDHATTIDFLVDVHDLRFLTSGDNRRQPNLMFVAAAWDEKGKAQGSVSGTYQQILQPADVQELIHTGLRLQQQLPLKPGSYQLRLGLVDRLSGRIGTIDVPLTVKPS